MKANYILLIICFFIYNISSAQNWEYISSEYIGNDHGNSVIHLASGGYLAVGDKNCEDTISVNCRTILVKVDEQGQQEFYWDIDLLYPSKGMDLFESETGAIYVLSTSIIDDKLGLSIAQISDDGQVLSERFYDQRYYTEGAKLLEASNEGVFVLGSFLPYENAEFSDLFVLKLNGNWQEEYFRTFSISSPDLPLTAIIKDAEIRNNGNLHFTGSRVIDSSSSSTAIHFIYNEEGDCLWKSAFNTTAGSTYGNSIILLADGLDIVSGGFNNGEKIRLYSAKYPEEEINLISEISSTSLRIDNGYLFYHSDSSFLLLQEEIGFPILKEIRNDGLELGSLNLGFINPNLNRKYFDNISTSSGGVLTGNSYGNMGVSNLSITKFDLEILVNSNNMLFDDLVTEVIIYPNPTDGRNLKFKIVGESEKSIGPIDILIYNNVGHEIYRVKNRGLNQGSVLLPKLWTGLYFIRFDLLDMNKSIYKKMVIQN